MDQYFQWFGLPGSFVLTCLMSLMAVVLAVFLSSPHRWLCAAAMIVSSLGDIVLMNFKNIGSRMPVPYFYVGAVLFMGAHLLYIGAFASRIRQNGWRLANAGFWTAAAFVLLIWIVLTVFSFRVGASEPIMYLLCLVYMCIIGCNCAVICSFAFSAGGWYLIAAAGALSFFISDLIIGIDRLTGFTTPALQEGIWWFYPIGQILIILFG